jgi:hypothetical protein
MAELRKGSGGAAMKHDLRAMLDAIGYLTNCSSVTCVLCCWSGRRESNPRSQFGRFQDQQPLGR